MTDSREDNFTVKAFDCQPNGRIKPNVLMQYLQEAAACHAEQLGLGFAAMEARGCIWVLANVRIEMQRAPRWNDRVTTRTWPSGVARPLFSREFIGQDQGGAELFRAGSEWMILDKHTGRPRNPARLDLDLPPAGDKVLSTALQRVQATDGCTVADTLGVGFSALDVNGHVNNTEYIRWAFDALHRMSVQIPEVHTLQVTYLAELFEGDRIEVLVSAPNERPMHVVMRKVESLTHAFLMDIDY